MTYTVKGPACPRTCKYPQGAPDCPTEHVEGCQCKPGLVQNIDAKVKAINKKEKTIEFREESINDKHFR